MQVLTKKMQDKIINYIDKQESFTAIGKEDIIPFYNDNNLHFFREFVIDLNEVDEISDFSFFDTMKNEFPYEFSKFQNVACFVFNSGNVTFDFFEKINSHIYENADDHVTVITGFYPEKFHDDMSEEHILIHFSMCGYPFTHKWIDDVLSDPNSSLELVDLAHKHKLRSVFVNPR